MPDRERRKLLNELCKICSQHCVIPTSMHIPDCSNDATEFEYAGGFSNVSKSTYRGYQVAIKVAKVNITNLKDVRSVSVQLLSPSYSHV
jgi:hypothetical protein